jgi:hypothetical protein
VVGGAQRQGVDGEGRVMVEPERGLAGNTGHGGDA